MSVTNAAEDKLPVLYSIAKAAKRLQVSYTTIHYAISKRWLKPWQEEPEVLIEEEALFDYANAREIPIPNEQ